MSFRKLLFKLILLLFFIVAFGTAGYMIIEHWGFLDALFMSVETLTTVGYGFIKPLSTEGRIFTIIYILFGVILFLYLAAEFANTITSFNLEKIMSRQKMEKKLKNMKDHYILCGYGRTGAEIASELKDNKIDFVIIDKDPSIEEKTRAFNVPFIVGDATEDETLEKANISEAKGILCSLSDDVDNLYLTLSAKTLNPGLVIVVRCIKALNEVKFRKAGASNIILPYEISGRRMVASIIKPEVVDFLDVAIHGKEQEFELKMEQFCIPSGSVVENKAIYESEIRQKTGVIIIAIKRNEKYISSPPPDTVLKMKDCLIILGTTQQLKNFEKFAA
ncbi:MAG: potassium channel protein [Candidatus Lokiarchaeota archaeon]|nr:potassium channel protein [Candidatus Lokiarchaeota archaeon]